MPHKKEMADKEEILTSPKSPGGSRKSRRSHRHDKEDREVKERASRTRRSPSRSTKDSPKGGYSKKSISRSRVGVAIGVAVGAFAESNDNDHSSERKRRAKESVGAFRSDGGDANSKSKCSSRRSTRSPHQPQKADSKRRKEGPTSSGAQKVGGDSKRHHSSKRMDSSRISKHGEKISSPPCPSSGKPGAVPQSPSRSKRSTREASKAHRATLPTGAPFKDVVDNNKEPEIQLSVVAIEEEVKDPDVFQELGEMRRTPEQPANDTGLVRNTENPTERNENSEDGKSTRSKRGGSSKGNYKKAIIIAFLVVLVAIGGVLAYLFLRKKPAAPATISAVRDTESPTNGPIQESILTTDPPSIDVATNAPTPEAMELIYDPPTEEDCISVKSQLPVEGQESMTMKTFQIVLDVTLDSDSSSEWENELLAGANENLVPELMGCQSSTRQLKGFHHDLERRLQDGDIRFVIANAVVSSISQEDQSCDSDASASCIRVSLQIGLFLKGEEKDFSVIVLISNIIKGDNDTKLYQILDLPSDMVSFVSFVTIRSLNPTEAPTIAPTRPPSVDSSNQPSSSPSTPIPTAEPSVNPTRAPAIGPTTDYPTVASSASPTSKPSPEPTKAPTEQPLPGATPNPTGAPSHEPSTSPSVAASGAPSLQPTSKPSSNPSLAPSGAPSSQPTSGPTYAPSVLPSSAPSLMTRRFILKSLLAARAPLHTEALDWLADVDTWEPSTGNVANDAALFFERYAMVVFYYATNGDSWTTNTGWLSSTSVCGWWNSFGNPSVCDVNSRMETIVLYNNGLSGSLPSELGLLTAMTYLHLQSNNIGSSIPSELGLLTSLNYLDLDDNALTGTLMTELGSLKDLTHLEIRVNALSGAIPSQIGLATKLTTFSLPYNGLISGALPTEFYKLTDLQRLGLRHNELTGSIATQIQQLTALTYLDFQLNSFVGELPSLENSVNLKHLDLDLNKFTGPMPSEYGLLTKLTLLAMRENVITGNLPSEIGKLTQLTRLEIQNNKFVGPLAVEFFQLTNIEYLDLRNDRFSGTIATEIGLFTALTYLDLHRNDFTGVLPPLSGGVKSYCLLNHNCFTDGLAGAIALNCTVDPNCN